MEAPRRSPLGLVVLGNLFEEPAHVYRLQKLIEAQGKDRVVNVRSRATLYQTIERLLRHGLVVVSDTIRSPGYPDRVIYAITDRGREVAREWLREMLHSTDGEYPEFIAAVSMMFALKPSDAQAELELRAQRLASALAENQAALAAAPAGLPRLFLLEEEYRATMLDAELGWVRNVIDELRDGSLTWSYEWLKQIAATFLPVADPHEREDN